MPLQRKTRQEIETAVSRKENFDRGNVWGAWKAEGFFTSTDISRLPKEFATMLIEHSKEADLFVLYSYMTPMAWYSLNDSGKWYYVDQRYSASTTGHQHAYRMALKGENVVTLSRDDEGNVVETEKEFY